MEKDTMTIIESIRDTATVLAKVQRLLEMTEANGCTENEAATAASKVQELLARHNLNLAALENAKTQTAPVYEKRERTDAGNAFHGWQRNLMECITNNNFCMWFVVRIGERGKKHQVLGRAVNVKVSIQTYEYLCGAMARLNPYKGDRKNASRWNDGCADRLVARLRQQRYEERQQEILVAGGLDEHSAYYVVRGVEVPPPPEPESAKERRERERREARYDRRYARWQARWNREEEREALRREDPAYVRGQEAGNDIGLDRQVDRQEHEQLN